MDAAVAVAERERERRNVTKKNLRFCFARICLLKKTVVKKKKKKAIFRPHWPYLGVALFSIFNFSMIAPAVGAMLKALARNHAHFNAGFRFDRNTFPEK